MFKIRICLALLLAAAAVTGFTDEQVSKKVLLISSGDHTQSTRFMVPFMRLMRESAFNCEFTSLELFSRNGTLLLSHDNRSWFESVMAKVKGGEFDGVIIIGDPAYQAFNPFLGDIPERTPVIFSGRVLFERLMPDGANVTGHSLRLAPEATAELALRLFPERKDLILITESSERGRRIEQRLRNFIRNNSGLTLTVLRGEEVSSDEAIEAIRTLCRHGVLIHHQWVDRKTGRADADHEFINQVGIRCPIPIFKLTEPDILQHGVVGGVAAGVLHSSGSDAARRLIRIFEGTPVAEIPPTVLPVQTVIHSEMIDFFAVAETLLPENALLLGRKTSLWLDYQQEILTGGIIVFSLLLSAFIFGLMFVLSRRSAYRNAEVVRTLPVRYFVVDGHDNILHYAACGDDLPRCLRTVADLPHAEASRLMSEKVAEVLKTGKNSSVEFEVAGRLRSAVISKLPTHLFHRETAVWISQDITELSDARKAAETNRSLLENLLAHLPVGIAARETVGDRKYVLCNEAFGKIIGRMAAEIENHTEAELNFAGFNPEVRNRQDNLVLESGRTLQFMEELFAVDGSHQVFQVTKFPLRLRDGEMLMVDTFTDITELEEAKRQTENANKLWDTVINAVPFFFYAKDADNDFRYSMANRKLAEFYNLAIDQLLGKNDRELKSDAVFPEENVRSDEAIMLLPNGKESTVELLDGSSRRRHVRIHKMPFTTIDGRRMLLGVGIDVSLLHNLLESERISNELLSYATLETDFEKTLGQIARTLLRQLNCDRMMIGCRDHAGPLRLYRSWRHGGPSPVEGDELEAHQALWNCHLDEFEADHLVTVSGEEEPNIDSKSLIMAPVRINQQLWGVVFVGYTGHRRVFSDVDERIMRSTANIIALSLIRKLQLDEIERSNREKQLILNNIGIPIWLYDAAGRMIRVNTAACTIIGMSESEILQMPCRRIFCADSTLDDQDCPVCRALASGKHEQITRRFNGREYIINAEPILDDDGKAINVVKSAIDVTDLNELMSNEQLLNTCMAAVLATDNPELSIKLVLEAFCLHLDADRCFILECNPESGRVSLFGEYQADESLPQIEIGSFRFKPDEPWMRKLQDREPLVVADLLSEEGSRMCGSWVIVAKQYGIRSIYSSGIFVNGKLWGKFGVVYQRNQRNFSEREL
ncbi:MAG: PAS domain-containing protein, partial [Victivallaceae bacterium]